MRPLLRRRRSGEDIEPDLVLGLTETEGLLRCLFVFGCVVRAFVGDGDLLAPGVILRRF